MSTPGITTTGPLIVTAPELKVQLDNSFAGVYGESLKSNPDGSIPSSTSIGQEEVILIDAESFQWLLFQATYNAFNPDTAVTPQLQVIGALRGVPQKASSSSVAIVACSGVIGTVLNTGRVLTVSSTGARFGSTGAAATLAAVSASWANTTPYAVYDLVKNNGYIWVCIQAGTSSVAPTFAGASPASTIGNVFTNASLKWQSLAVDTAGVALVSFQAEQTGAIAANANTLVNIATPVTGWNAARNPLAAAMGRAIESEPAYRARQLAELQGSGGGPLGAIRAYLLGQVDIDAVQVFENTSNVTDADGLPPHSVECLIESSVGSAEPTTDDELAQYVFNCVGAGIDTYGNHAGAAHDTAGNSYTVRFSRPVDVPIYVKLTVIYNASVWTSTTPLIAAVRSAIITYGAGLAIGWDVRASQIAGAVEDGLYLVDAAGDPAVATSSNGGTVIPGIYGVANYAGTDGTLPLIGDAPAPASSATVAITKRQRATFDASNVAVNCVSGTP